MKPDTAHRFGPMNGDKRWGAFVYMPGWMYVFYWGGTAYCKECDNPKDASSVLDDLRAELNDYDIGNPHHERRFNEYCKKNGWDAMSYYGGMTRLRDGKALPIPTCEY